MTYAIREIFKTIQGEGQHAGRQCVFVRFAGCNVWSGVEEEREEAARTSGGCARYCDTVFNNTDGPNGGYKTAEDVAITVGRLWGGINPETWKPYLDNRAPWVVMTGGEPSIQLNAELVNVLHAHGFKVAVETNGSRPLPSNVDWITLSPKPPKRVVLERADEIKVLYPEVVNDPEAYAHLAAIRWLQPIDQGNDGVDYRTISPLTALKKCVDYAVTSHGTLHPWGVSIQLHKLVGMP